MNEIGVRPTFNTSTCLARGSGVKCWPGPDVPVLALLASIIQPGLADSKEMIKAEFRLFPNLQPFF
jgi:hypothetical protein